MDAGEITEECVQKTVLRWQVGVGQSRPLQKSSVQNIVMLLKQILKYACKKGMTENRALDIHFMPRNQPVRRQVFSVSEQKKLIRSVLSDLSFKSFGILLCISSGMRIGELCALKWRDIDLSNGLIHVTRTLQRIYKKDSTPKTQIMISTPKTGASIRDIPLSSQIVRVIGQLGSRNEDGYVLTNSERFTEPRTFRKFYKAFLKEHDIDDLHFHCLRHTFATRCIENGADIKSVSEILGHASVNITLNRYVHPHMEEKRKCVELIEWSI